MPTGRLLLSALAALAASACHSGEHVSLAGDPCPATGVCGALLVCLSDGWRGLPDAGVDAGAADRADASDADETRGGTRSRTRLPLSTAPAPTRRRISGLTSRTPPPRCPMRRMPGAADRADAADAGTATAGNIDAAGGPAGDPDARADARPEPPASLPSTGLVGRFPGLVLWLDSARGITAAPEDVVTVSKDRSPAGDDAVKQSLQGGPKVVHDTVLGRVAVRFGWGDQPTALVIADSPSLQWGVGDVTVFAALRWRNKPGHVDDEIRS